MNVICGKAFAHHSLQSPKRTHTREKPYECICVGKSFLAKVLFKSIKHILERKAYECQCGKAFAY